ncbi:MAG: tetratricopeptide repeat protein [Steroidobacteraceae bacterium]
MSKSVLVRRVSFAFVSALVMCGCTGAESRKASFVSQGQQHMASHDWQKARLDFRNALQIDPKDAKVQFLAAQAAERAGEYPEAAGRYGALFEQDKNNLQARVALGRLYAAGGLAAEATKLAEEGLAGHPDDAGLLAVRGVARMARGDRAGALEDAKAAVAKEPNNADAAALLASILAGDGKRDEALALLERVSKANADNVGLKLVLTQLLTGIGRASDAERELQEVIRLEPNELAHRYRLSNFYLLQQNVDAAELALREAVKIAPDKAQPKLALADFIASHRSFETGEKSLKELVSGASSDYDLRMGFGDFYASHQRSAQAEQVYRDIVRDAGTAAAGLEARDRIAALYLASNRTTEASALLEEVLQKNPRDPGALLARAGIALDRGAATGAIADLRAVLRDAPASMQALRMLARAYEVNHDVGLAEETLRGAIRANPSDVQSRLALAQLLMRNGRGDEAQPVADQAVKDRPGDVDGLRAAFQVQVERRDMAGARATAVAIQSLRPDLPDGYFLVGLVNEALGNRADALAAFERATAVSPTAVEPVAAAARIDLQLQQNDRAMEQVSAALDKSPKNAALLAVQGNVLLRLKRYDEAAEALQNAVSAAPGWWVAYRDLAQVERSRGRNEAAVATYLRGIDATGFSPELLTQLGELYERLGRIDEAMVLYDGWLKRDSESVVAANNYAMLLVNYRSRDAASIQRAVQLTNRLRDLPQPQYQDTYGWVRYLAGDAKAALVALGRADAALPDRPEIRAHLGLAQMRVGETGPARRNLEAVVNRLEGLPERKLVDAALESLPRAH